MPSPPTLDAIVDTKDAAQAAGLIYVSDAKPGISRKRRGKSFRYLDAKGASVRDEPTLKRIRALAVPPAWTHVWICPKANGHIQATGRDAKGRKQYRYHPRFREVRESTKYHHMLAFAESLPKIRETVERHLAMRSLSREKVLATVVHLLERTLIRVGSDEYARANKSFGLTTLKTRHVEIDGTALKFNFKGKSGKIWKLDVRDKRIAKVIRACQDLRGQDLFQYIDGDGRVRDVTSSDVNDYLHEITGADITAKDFRTWHGTVLAAMALSEFEKIDSQAATKRNIKEAIQTVAARLGNTPTICRKCYVHPEIISTFVEGALLLEVQAEVDKEMRDDLPSLCAEEAAVLSLLRTRLSLTLEDKLKASLAA